MRAFDLVTGCETDLPREVDSGRYRILVDATLNDSIQLKAGDILWTPGTGRCDLQARKGDVAESHVFLGFASEQDADQDLVVRAVQAVVDELDEHGLTDRPSPVMPGKLKEQAELTELEKRLAKDMPHLFNIERSPRMSMRYDAELTPTSRARRLASGALVRLASHSDDWNRRDFKGVSPRRLLAEVSEDELYIYENVVYARLLDRLYIHLNQRVRSLRTLEARRTDAAAIANAEELDHRLRYRLCALWGTAYSTDAQSKSAGSDVLSELSTLMKKIMRLRLGRLYQAIPSGSRVPQVLRTTNVLLHDQNYKRLRPLWSMAHAVGSDQARTAKMKIEAAEGRYQQFRRYVSLLIQHALSSSKLLKPGRGHAEYRFGQWSLTLAESARGEFLLHLKSGALDVERRLTFAPVWRGQGQWPLDGSERQVMFCYAPPSATEDASQWGTGEDAVLNPLQFYSVERVKARIEAWLISRLASVYPMVVSPWPHASAQALCSAFPGTFSAEGCGLRVLKPVADQDQARLRSLIQSAGASEVGISSMWLALQAAELVATCKVCGDVVTSRGVQADRKGFKAVCVCGFSWKWRFDAATKERQGSYAYGDAPRPFEVIGSDEFRLSL
ncbi:hypothetical protein [Aquabacterium sp. A08]|uniref:hypothetical protein n=1 Tax=Aquabacterium sp. A08 TaxID=2718532 RepID=UPI001422FA81|nr:hypothetical protein [Aquabacterium sp. A08]NIC42662.1 hypothetical protein [Aquabacterium sp. A08]